MIKVISSFIAAIFLVAIFTLIPFIFFSFRKDKSVTFSKYIGLYKPPAKAIFFALGLAAILIVIGIIIVFNIKDYQQFVISPNSFAGEIRLMGFGIPAILILLIRSILATSLWEEIFFRGFIAKRLTNKLGFQTGNIIQALIFGLTHMLLTLSVMRSVPLMLIIFCLTTFAGWAIGYIKEKYGNGSIIPGWIQHATSNIVAFSIYVFFL